MSAAVRGSLRKQVQGDAAQQLFQSSGGGIQLG